MAPAHFVAVSQRATLRYAVATGEPASEERALRRERKIEEHLEDRDDVTTREITL